MAGEAHQGADRSRMLRFLYGIRPLFLHPVWIVRRICNANPEGFQPMNANFGIMAPLDFPHKKKERKGLYAKRALEIMQKEIEQL